MAKVLAVLCSGRKKGYTATLLAHAVEGAQEVPGVEVEVISTFNYYFGPCQSCFNCVRNPQNMCTLNDDFGKGKGNLLQKVSDANALLLAEPVHMWSTSTSCHLFIERLYPFLWNGRINGMPFASISCASNQGFQRFAAKEICRRLIPYNMRVIDTLALHTAMPNAAEKARDLGRRLGKAAQIDEEHGRQAFKDEVEKFNYFLNQAENALTINLENLTNGLFTYEGSLIEMGEKFTHPEGLAFARKAAAYLKEALDYYRDNNTQEAIIATARASDYWANATWKEFLEDNVMKAKMPKAYKPLPE